MWLWTFSSNNKRSPVHMFTNDLGVLAWQENEAMLTLFLRSCVCFPTSLLWLLLSPILLWSEQSFERNRRYWRITKEVRVFYHGELSLIHQMCWAKERVYCPGKLSAETHRLLPLLPMKTEKKTKTKTKNLLLRAHLWRITKQFEFSCICIQPPPLPLHHNHSTECRAQS